MEKHRYYAEQALKIAQAYQGYCAPNPAVGAVLVQDDQIIATGVHKGCGLAHAERDLLLKVETVTPDMVLYVTLEPCCHTGRTPPCTDIIIAKGVKHVVFAVADPHPLACNGRSVLAAAGVKCEQVESVAITKFYQPYLRWLNTKQPWVTSKLAVSLDGAIAATGGKPVQLTGEAAAEFTHQQRNTHDAILTTAKTILADDPQLNVRLPGKDKSSKTIYVLDSRLEVESSARVFSTAKQVICFYQAGLSQTIVEKRLAEGRICLPVKAESFSMPSAGKNNLQAAESQTQILSWKEILAAIGAAGVHTLWVEAGGRCNTSLLLSGLLQKLYLYIAPCVVGTGAVPAFAGLHKPLWEIGQAQWSALGRDGLCEIDFQ